MCVFATESTLSCVTSSLILSSLPDAVEHGLIRPSSRKQRADCHSRTRLPSQRQSWSKANVSVKVRVVSSTGEWIWRALRAVTILVQDAMWMISHRWKRVSSPRQIPHRGGEIRDSSKYVVMRARLSRPTNGLGALEFLLFSLCR